MISNKKAVQEAMWMIRDTVQAASSQAFRASEMLEGEEVMVLFHDLGIELSKFAETSPAMKALSTHYFKMKGE